jgi:hypothetical protein
VRIIDHIGPALVWSLEGLNRLEGWVGQRLAPLWRAYWMLVAALTIVCLTTTVLALVATLNERAPHFLP